MRFFLFFVSSFLVLGSSKEVQSSDALTGVENPLYGWGVPIRDRFGNIGNHIVSKHFSPEERCLLNAPSTYPMFQNSLQPHGLNLKNIERRGSLFQKIPEIEDGGQDLSRFVAAALAIKKKVVEIKSRIDQLEQQGQSLMRPTLQASMGEVGTRKKMTYKKTYVEGELNTFIQTSNHQPKDYNQARGGKIEHEQKSLLSKLSLLEQDLEKGLNKIHELTGVPFEKLRHLSVSE